MDSGRLATALSKGNAWEPRRKRSQAEMGTVVVPRRHGDFGSGWQGELDCGWHTAACYPVKLWKNYSQHTSIYTSLFGSETHLPLLPFCSPLQVTALPAAVPMPTSAGSRYKMMRRAICMVTAERTDRHITRSRKNVKHGCRTLISGKYEQIFRQQGKWWRSTTHKLGDSIADKTDKQITLET